MIVRFGMTLDGMQPSRPVTAAGDVSLGPSGLLGVLETQLGLPSGVATAAEELSAYRACIDALSDRNAFYWASYTVDPISVVRTLLDWRATWYEHGWEGTFAANDEQRLADMANLETATFASGLLCRGQRVRRVLSALEGRRTQIEQLILLDPIDELPFIWRELVSRFNVAAPAPLSAASLSTTSDLYTVQATLLASLTAADEAAGERLSLKGDSSFVVVRGVSRDISARLTAEHVLCRGDLEHTLVLAERDGIILDNALSLAGLPRAGFQHFTPYRAVSQVLPLSLGLLWRPLRLKLLLQFLQHPVAPLKRSVRARLADAVARQPGVGGSAWRAAIESIETNERKRGSDDQAIGSLNNDIGFWLQCAEYDPDTGAPAEVLIRRSQACANWLAQRLNTAATRTDRDVYARAYRQAADLMHALSSLGSRDAIGKIELDNLIDAITRDSPDPDLVAEAGHVRTATQPGAITDTWQRVIWWDLAPVSAGARYPWSDAELTALRSGGVALPDVSSSLSAQARQWLVPLMAARDEAVLVVHHYDQGEHPLWTQIKSRFTGWREVRPDEQLLQGVPSLLMPGLDIQVQPLTVRPLPGKQRWWHIDGDNLVPPRAVESYSGLEKLLNYPHQWVLNYPAGLRPGRAQALATGNLLNGNLVHRVFEQFFESFDSWREVSDEQAHRWLHDQLPELIRSEGAVLLEPGAGVAREQFTNVAEIALTRLLAALREGNIVQVRAEHEDEAPFKAGRLRGFIDLLLGTANGQEVVMDVKWGGQNYRGESLQQDRYLQLATYAYLRHAAARDRHAAWPSIAFFIASTGAVLAHDHTIFPHVRHYPSEHGGSAAGVWRTVGAGYDWRRRQLSEGRIEVNVAGTAPDQDSVPPEHAYPPSAKPGYFDDYLALTGWEESD